MTMLQNDRLITVDFEDNAATGAFRYLINNIGRVIDYYVTKNPDKPIDDVYLTGDGALIRGIDGLFKIQLNIQTKIMDSLYNVKFDPKIDQKIYNPVYLVSAIGAAYDPMGFKPSEVKASSKGDTNMFKPVATVGGIVIAAAVVAAVGSVVMKNNAVQKRDNLNAHIASIQYIDDIITQYDAANAKYDDIKIMYDTTRTLNENFNMFIDNLEGCIPKDVAVDQYSSNEGDVSISGTSTSYDAIAKFVIELKKLDCISDAFVSDVAEEESDIGENTFKFNVTCQFVSMVEEEQIGVQEDDNADGSTLEAE